MATANCTYQGLAAYNGGWDDRGYTKTVDSYIGNGNPYGCVLKFVVPSAAGAASGRSLTVSLGLRTLYYSSYTLQYWVTTEGRPSGSEYGDTPPQIRGTVILSGEVAVSGLNTSSWVTKSFVTGTTSSLPAAGGTYYIWLRATANGVVQASAPAITLNYTAITACAAPTSFSVSPSPFESPVTLVWSGASAGVSNAINAYEIQYATSSDGSNWSGWSALKTVSTTAASGSTTDTPSSARGGYEKYRIRTRGSGGSSYYSGWRESNAVRKNRLPTSPTSFSGSASLIASDSTIRLYWSGAADADGNMTRLRVQKSTNGGSSWTDATTVSAAASGSANITLSEAAGTTVQFRIRAEDALGAVGSWKTGVSVVINSAPTSPTSFTASRSIVKHGDTITLVWSGANDINNNITGYRLDKSTDGGNSYSPFKTVNTTAKSGSIDVQITEAPGTTVQFRIIPFDGFGLSASSYKYGPAVVVNSAPVAPTSVTVDTRSDGNDFSFGDMIMVHWRDAADVNNNISTYTVGCEYGGRYVTLATVASSGTGGGVAIKVGDAIPDNTALRFWVRVSDELGETSGYAFAAGTYRRMDKNLYLYRDGARVRKSIYYVKNGIVRKMRLYHVKDGAARQIFALSANLPSTPLTIETAASGDGEITIARSISGVPIKGTMTATGSGGDIDEPEITVQADGKTYTIRLPRPLRATEIDDEAAATYSRDGVHWIADVYDLYTGTLTDNTTTPGSPIVYNLDVLEYPPVILCGAGTTTIIANGFIDVNTQIRAVT